MQLSKTWWCRCFDNKHYQKTLIRRVPESLPWAFFRAHGKQMICRASARKHTANTKHTANRALRRVSNRRHTANMNHVARTRVCRQGPCDGLTAIIVCCVPESGTRRTQIFAVCHMSGTRRRLCLPCASVQHTANTKKNSCFCFQMFSTLSIFRLILYVWIWYFYIHISCI